VTTHRRVRGVVYDHHCFTSEALANIIYTDCDFSHADLAAAFPIKDVTFDHCDLSHASFPTSLYNVAFTNSNLTNADFTDSILNSAHFEAHNADALLSGARSAAAITSTLPALYLLTPLPHRPLIDKPPLAGTLGIDIRRPAFVDFDFDAIANAAGFSGLTSRAVSLAKEHPRLSAASLVALLRATAMACVPATFCDTLKV
jgi:hypothetical protein